MRVTPGGKSPFSGKSSKVIATFCAAHTFTISEQSVDKEIQPGDETETDVTFPQSGELKFGARNPEERAHGLGPGRLRDQ